jgi:hypothetical protein
MLGLVNKRLSKPAMRLQAYIDIIVFLNYSQTERVGFEPTVLLTRQFSRLLP